jgi:ATP-binding cassette subfamily F protein uup
MRAERRSRRELQGRAQFDVEEAQRSGRLVIEAERVSFAFGSRPIVRDLSLRILRGDRIGLIGPNGVGKTTLLRLLLGQLAPDAGRVRLGTKLEIAYFDQLRMQLEPEKTVIENVAGGSEIFEIGGERRHVIGYLQEFLFSPDRARTRVATLSGGERNRLLLARLLAAPANLLVLDEPTNDLDIETLELLEERLLAFGGTILLVSHDRAFLDNVVTSTLAFEGEGRVFEYVGGYTDALRQRRTARVATPVIEKLGRGASRSTSTPRPVPARLSRREQRELDELPARIEALEREQGELASELGRPGFYRGEAALQARVHARLAALPAELEVAYARWESLDARR